MSTDDDLFDVLARIAEKFGWELSVRDPGPDTEVDTFSDVWRDDTHFADCGCLWSNDLDLLEMCDEHSERPEPTITVTPPGEMLVLHESLIDVDDPNQGWRPIERRGAGYTPSPDLINFAKLAGVKEDWWWA